MPGPRFDAPKDRDRRESDAASRRAQTIDRVWGWTAGIAAAVLIVLLLIGGWRTTDNTASMHTRPPAASTAGQAPAPQPAGAW